MMGLSD
jgi:hypothetical protein